MSAESLITGDGPKAKMLAQMSQGLNRVRLLGWLGARDLAQLLARSHVGLACYSAHATQSVTYKLFDYLAAGLPILCSLPGEMSEIIEREGVGFPYKSGDPEGLAALVRDICAHAEELPAMAEAARAFTELNGDARNVYGEMADFLASVAAGTS